jgi:H+/Cl- antiporter ClcA
MRISELIDKRAIQRGRRLWLHYGVFWLGAIATGLLAVLYAQLIDIGYNTFLRYGTRYWWLPVPVTPAIGAATVWLTRRHFPGAEGSGIPQVIATLHDDGTLGPRLLSIRILVGKIAVSFLSILGGFTIGAGTQARSRGSSGRFVGGLQCTACRCRFCYRRVDPQL